MVITCDNLELIRECLWLNMLEVTYFSTGHWLSMVAGDLLNNKVSCRASVFRIISHAYIVEQCTLLVWTKHSGTFSIIADRCYTVVPTKSESQHLDITGITVYIMTSHIKCTYDIIYTYN